VEILKRKSESSGNIFFLFYVFRDLKAELISKGLRDKAQEVVLKMPGTAV
jgi:hypothetical protein